MRTTYYNLKSELTARKEHSEGLGYNVYRTRTTCQCADGKNRRDAVLVADGDVIVWKLVRCKACTSLAPHPVGTLSNGREKSVINIKKEEVRNGC